MDIEALLAPVSEETPTGPDLAYDPDFIALEAASRGKAEQQFGDTVIAAEEPDWREIGTHAEGLLARSKDLRLAVLAAHAQTRMRNVEGLAEGLRLVSELTSRYWDSVHPDLDHEDNDDPTMRLNALGPLADVATFVRDVRNAVLVASPQHGRVTIRDILVADGKLPPIGEATPMTPGEIKGIVTAVARENPQPLRAAVDSLAHLRGLEAFLSEKGVLTQAPEFAGLAEVLKAAAAVSSEALRAIAPADAQSAEGTEGAGEAAPGAAVAMQASGHIRSREDALKVLDKVCEFMEQSEPANPAPLFIRRAQRLMSRNFMEIIQELAPESLEQIQKLAGIEEK